MAGGNHTFNTRALTHTVNSSFLTVFMLHGGQGCFDRRGGVQQIGVSIGIDGLSPNTLVDATY